jgi:hypothetical protein
VLVLVMIVTPGDFAVTVSIDAIATLVAIRSVITCDDAPRETAHRQDHGGQRDPMEGFHGFTPEY